MRVPLIPNKTSSLSTECTQWRSWKKTGQVTWWDFEPSEGADPLYQFTWKVRIQRLSRPVPLTDLRQYCAMEKLVILGIIGECSPRSHSDPIADDPNPPPTPAATPREPRVKRPRPSITPAEDSESDSNSSSSSSSSGSDDEDDDDSGPGPEEILALFKLFQKVSEPPRTGVGSHPLIVSTVEEEEAFRQEEREEGQTQGREESCQGETQGGEEGAEASEEGGHGE